MRRVFLFIIVCYFCCIPPLYASDWKVLYERADKISVNDALANVLKKPDSQGDLYILGLVYLNLHKDKEAEEVFNKILNAGHDSIEAKWGLAEVLRRKHDLDKAESNLQKIIESEPEFSPAYISLSYIKFVRMDYETTVRLANKVLQQGRDKVDLSNYVRACLLVAGAKGMIAHYGGALSKLINGTAVFPNLKKAEKLAPDTAGVKFGLGAFYLLAPPLVGGDINKAEKYLKEAIERDEFFADSFVRLAQVYKVKGDNAKYEENLNKALKIDPLNELALDIKSGKCKFICVVK